jgi:hypothetical protein
MYCQRAVDTERKQALVERDGKDGRPSLLGDDR